MAYLISLYEIKTQNQMKTTDAYAFGEPAFELHERTIARLKTLSREPTCQVTYPTLAASYTSSSFNEADTGLICNLVLESSILCDFLPQPYSVICKLATLTLRSTCIILINRERSVLW
jgi:hypothetical protein